MKRSNGGTRCNRHERVLLVALSRSIGYVSIEKNQLHDVSKPSMNITPITPQQQKQSHIKTDRKNNNKKAKRKKSNFLFWNMGVKTNGWKYRSFHWTIPCFAVFHCLLNQARLSTVCTVCFDLSARSGEGPSDSYQRNTVRVYLRINNPEFR